MKEKLFVLNAKDSPIIALHGHDDENTSVMFTKNKAEKIKELLKKSFPAAIYSPIRTSVEEEY